MQQSHSNGPNNSTSSNVASHSNTQKANNQLPKPAKRHKSNNEAASNTITYNPILTDPSTGLPVTNLNNQQFIQVQLPPTVGQKPHFIQLVPSPLNKMDQTNSIQVQKHTSFVTNLPQGSPLKIGNSSTPVLLSPIRTISTIAQSTPPLKFISNTKRNIIPVVSPRKPIDAVQGSSPQNSVLSTRKVQTVLTSINPSFLLANPNIKIQPAQPKPVPNKIKIKNPGSTTGQAMQSNSQLQPPFLMPKTSTAPQTQFPMFVPISLAGNMFNSSNNQTNNTLRIHQQFQSASTTKKPANVVTINPSNHSFLIPVQLQQKPANQQQKQQPQYFVHKVNNIQPAVPSSPKPSKARSNNASSSEMKPLKKPCNCTKSQCLKLYCECFANGEFCTNCNCRSCLNNIAHEAERSKAIKACLERNPYAFHPKIGKGRVKGDTERRHTKGCNCKRSGCLKNYCECYEAKILCSSLCKCVGCKNYEESADRKTLMHLADAAEVRVLQQNAARSKLDSEMKSLQKHNPLVKDRSRVSFMTPDVAKMTRDIMLARVQDAESVNQEESEIERSVLEEFNRCLNQIIDKSNLSANKNKR